MQMRNIDIHKTSQEHINKSKLDKRIILTFNKVCINFMVRLQNIIDIAIHQSHVSYTGSGRIIFSKFKNTAIIYFLA